MKKLLPLLLLLILCGLFSCTEVITIDLNSTSPKLVVEGNVSNHPGPYTIKLSRTANFFDANNFPAETGAQVIIADNAGHADTLHQPSPGTYVTSTLNGVIGRTYSILISVGGQKYTASALMTDTVTIDSLSFALRPPRPPDPGPGEFQVTTSFTDPVTPGNYYGIRLYRNRVLLDDIISDRIISDKLSNGIAQHPRIRDQALMPNDTVRMELVCFEKSAYDFYNTIKATLNSGGPFSAPPANPVTNLSNGAVGYFGVFATTSKTIVLH